MKTFQFQCAYCDKKYKVEQAFLKHECNEMLRADEIKTIKGRRAYEYYCTWNSVRQYAIPDERAFIISQHYLAFQRFEKFVRNVRLPAPDQYIKLMVEKGMFPSMWTNNLAYKHYIEHLDRRLSPKQQAEVTINTIMEISDKYEIDTSEFFDYVIPNEFIQCVVRRQLSPWILFNSQKFLEFYTNELSPMQQEMFDGIHPLDKWSVKFLKNKKQLKKMREYVDELDL